MLASANGLFFLIAVMLPGTVPLGVAAAIVIVLERRGTRTRRSRSKHQLWPKVRPLPRPPGTEQPMEA